MKRLLKAMLNAALPILGVISFVAIIYVAYIICVAMGLDAGMCMGVLFIVFAYMAGVFVFYKMDE